MGIVVDVILCSIIILNVFIGYKKGLIKVAFNIFAFFIAIIATFILFKPISNLVIHNTQIDDKIKETIVTKVSRKQEQKESDENKEFIQSQYID